MGMSESTSNGKANTQAPSLAGKIARMMGEVAGVQKRGWNPHHKYNYVLSTDVYEATRDLMARHGVILVQRPMLDHVERTEKNTRNGSTVHIKMAWEFCWMDADTGESIIVPWVSEAEDGQDKGANKAATAARKYFLVTQLQIPVDQDDADAGPASGNGRQAAGMPPAAPPAAGTPPAYRMLAALAQRVHQEPKPLQAVIDTLAAEGIIAEELGTVQRLTDLPLAIVERAVTHYRALAEERR
jgi:hypothetical protein